MKLREMTSIGEIHIKLVGWLVDRALPLLLHLSIPLSLNMCSSILIGFYSAVRTGRISVLLICFCQFSTCLFPAG